MKKIIFTAILLASVGMNAQNGKVGIGTTTPTAALDVVSDGNSSTTNGFTLTNSDDRLTFKIADNGDISGSGMTLNKKTYSGLNEETYLNIQSPSEHSVIQMRSIASKSSQFRFFTATFDANGLPLTENREFTIRSERTPSINTNASIGDLMLDLNGDNSLHVNDNTNTTLMVVKQNGLIGIGNSAPKATLDVQGKPTNAAIADGIIAPLLTGDQLAAKDAVYDASKTGAIVYVTAAATTPSGKTVEVTSAGYYYFDGTIWQGVSYENIYNRNGTLTGNRVVTQGTRNLAFTASNVNAFSVDGTTFSVDASNNRVGIGTATPNAPLSVGSARQVNLGLSGGTSPSGNFIGFNTIASTSNNFSTTAAASSGLNNTFTIWNNNQNGEVLFTPYTVADPTVSENFNPRTEAAMVIKHDSKNVGIGTITPVAKLDVNGMIKIGTSAATPVAGMIQYGNPNGTGTGFYGYNGTVWVKLDN